MINLIPNQEKKKMAADFYLRLFTIFFVVIALAFFVGTLLLVPAYSLSLTQKNTISEKLEIEKELPLFKSNQEVLSTVRDLNIKINLLEKVNTDKFIVSERVIDEIILKKMSDIKINQISYEKNFLNEKSIYVQGNAPSRERLLVFRQMLENNPLFSEIDLPISNFIKGTNISFSLSLIPS